MAFGVLVPQPGIEPLPPAVEVQSPNHWTTREFSSIYFSYCYYGLFFLTWKKMNVSANDQ